jgi:hypothetical protein
MNARYHVCFERGTMRKRFQQAQRLLIPVVFCVAGAMMNGCNIGVQDVLSLQHVEVNGPASQPPIHVAAKSGGEKKVYVTPRLSLNPTSSLSGKVSPQYTGKVPDTIPDFKKKGLDWNFSRLQFGFDLDYAFSDGKAFMCGLSQSVANQQSLWGGYAGIGFFGGENTPVRLDLGLQFQEISYRAATVIERTETPLFGRTTTSTYYFVDKDKDVHVNFFASFTVNGVSNDRVANPFFQAAVSTQRLTSFSPGQSKVDLDPFFAYTRTDQRAESSTFWFHATPGVYFNVGESNRVLLGLRLSTQSGIDNANPGFVISPVLQFDWTL